MERKIGEEFEMDGVKYRVISGADCKKCCFHDSDTCPYIIEHTGQCEAVYRNDGNEILFERAD